MESDRLPTRTRSARVRATGDAGLARAEEGKPSRHTRHTARQRQTAPGSATHAISPSKFISGRSQPLGGGLRWADRAASWHRIPVVWVGHAFQMLVLDNGRAKHREAHRSIWFLFLFLASMFPPPPPPAVSALRCSFVLVSIPLLGETGAHPPCLEAHPWETRRVLFLVLSGPGVSPQPRPRTSMYVCMCEHSPSPVPSAVPCSFPCTYPPPAIDGPYYLCRLTILAPNRRADPKPRAFAYAGQVV